MRTRGFALQTRPGPLRTALLMACSALVGLMAFALGWHQATREPAPSQGTVAAAANANVPRHQQSALPTAKAASAVADSGVPWPLWEFQVAQPIPELDPPRTPLPWRLIGAGKSNGKWQLIVLRQGRTEPEYFAVGDKLAGGYRIEAISDEDVTLKQGRKTLILSYIGTQ